MIVGYTFFLDDDWDVEGYTRAFGEMLKDAKTSDFYPRHITRQIVGKDEERFCMKFTYIFERDDSEVRHRNL